MQTPKAKSGFLEVPQRKSPATPRTAKTSGSNPDSVSSLMATTRTPKGSPKVTERRSPRSPVAERKLPKRVSELESQLSQLQEDLKRAKDQLNSSESARRRYQKEAEETKNQLLSMSAKLEESEQQLQEISACEDARIQELRQLSQDRDRAWESELQAVQQQRSMDSTALASAVNEIQKLKDQLEMVANSEATQSIHAESADAEIQTLRRELSETLSLVEKLKAELSDCKESEARAIELIDSTRMQLERANVTIESLQSDRTRGSQYSNSLSLELEQSKDLIKSLEGLVSKLQAEVAISNCNQLVNSSGNSKPTQEGNENEETVQLKEELDCFKSEVNQLRSALEVAEMRHQEEYNQSTLQIRSAYDEVESTKSESCQREAEWTSELKQANALQSISEEKDHVEDLRTQLMDKENALQSISEEKDRLSLQIEKNVSSEGESELATELKKSETALVELKANLMDKETELQNITEENEMLKIELHNKEMERNNVNSDAVVTAEAARDAEREALLRVGNLTEEVDKSTQRVAQVTEQLDAAQVANSELEAELRRLKVQSDQWRKAAEAAAAIISTGNNGKYVERTGSLDSRYNPLSSPCSEDLDDDSPKKKNVTMLKKIGVLWKKGQK